MRCGEGIPIPPEGRPLWAHWKETTRDLGAGSMGYADYARTIPPPDVAHRSNKSKEREAPNVWTGRMGGGMRHT